VETYLEVMFKFEGFITLWTLELAEDRTLVVAYHMPLQSIHVGEGLVANLARL
jgi:hypothetical protein